MAACNCNSNTPGVAAVTADNTAPTGPGSNGVHALTSSSADSAVYGEHRGTGIGVFGRGGAQGGEGVFGQTASRYCAVYGKNTSTTVSGGVEYFGYWADAFHDLGDFISETTANGANIVDIRQSTISDLTTKLSEARQRGAKAMVDIEQIVFGDGHLKTDWQNQWTTNIKTPIVSNGFLDTVAAFYLRDEPYLNGASIADLNALKAQLNADFPSTPLAAILSQREVFSMGLDSSYVSMLDWVGFDAYDTWSSAYGTPGGMPTLISTLRSWLRNDQRMIALPAAALPIGSFPDASASSQDWMIDSNINMWQQEVMSDAKYIMVMPFLWQSLGGTTGTRDMPRIKARLSEMAYSLLHDANNYIPTSTNPGVTGESASGTGVVGISNLAGVAGGPSPDVPGGAGVVGSNDQLNGRGVVGQANGDSGTGVQGTGTSLGVQGTTTDGVGVEGSSVDGVGVVGVSDTNDGVRGNSSTGVGVRGVSSTNGYNFGVVGTGPNAGVVAFNPQNTNAAYLASACCAAWFTGGVHVAGHLSKTGGGFLIDHPTDPAHTFMSHSFVESSERKNVYDGVAVTDAKGQAVVELPTWFQPLNTSFRYQLTALGAPAPNLHVAAEIQENQFTIAGAASNSRVSWQVTGIRHDAWAVAHPLTVEEAKPDSERGKYLHPELHGQPDDHGIELARHPQQLDDHT